MLRWTLDDRHRKKLVGVLIVVLGWTFWDFGHMLDDRQLLYDEARAAPEAFSDRVVVISYSYVRRLEADRFYLRHFGREVEIAGRLPNLAPGAVVSVRGRILADRRFVLEEGYVHRGRRLKRFVGVVTLLAAVVVLFREVRRA